MSITRPVVTILQHRLLHYRVDFFERLRASCKANGINLELVHGQASLAERMRNDEGAIDWAHKVENRYLSLFGRDLLWQPLPKRLQESDLIILMQENRIISNYPFLFRLRSRSSKLAYWGHGANFQSRAPDGIRERWKSSLIGKVDWWFAYTEATVRLLRREGFPEDRIACLNNAIDTTEFATQVRSVSDTEKFSIRRSLGIPRDAQIGIFCGSLYSDKRLGLLVSAGDLIRHRTADFHIIVIGNGPDAALLREAASERPWLHLVGVKRGQEKASLFALGDVMLNPGALGLHILDAFCLGMPLISTRDAAHGPEVEYLKSGWNGELVENSADVFADAVIKLIIDKSYRRHLESGALASAEQYSLDQMVKNFTDGILGCLNRDKLASQ